VIYAQIITSQHHLPGKGIMDKDVDLSIRLAELTFKSPIVAASSECAANLFLIQNLVKTF